MTQEQFEIKLRTILENNGYDPNSYVPTYGLPKPSFPPNSLDRLSEKVRLEVESLINEFVG